jgi:hypothetical protein
MLSTMNWFCKLNNIKKQVLFDSIFCREMRSDSNIV